MWEKIKQLDSYVFKAICVLFTLIMITQTLNLDNLTSLFFYPLLLLSCGLYGLELTKKIDKLDYLILSIIILSFIGVIINGYLNEASFSINYLKKMILFDIVCIYIQTMNKRKCSLSDKLSIYSVFDFLSILFCLAYILQGPGKYHIDGRVSNYLTFKFSNPNLIAMILLGLFIFQTINVLKESNRNQRNYRIITGLLLFIFILETKARNTQLVMLMYLIGYFIINFTNLKFKFDKWLSMLICTFPAIFFSIYMLVIENPIIKNIFGFMEETGKELNSRMKIWVPGFDGFLKSPIIGNYYGISDGTGASHLHNSHLDIAASFGIIVLVIICIYLFLVIFRNKKANLSKEKQSYLLAFCSMLLLGMGETALFSGALGMQVLMTSFLMLSRE